MILGMLAIVGGGSPSLALMDRMQMLHTHAHHTPDLALVPVPTV